MSTFATGLRGPVGLVIGSQGSVCEADAGAGSIVQITAAGVESTFGPGLNYSLPLALDTKGNLYGADGNPAGSVFEFSLLGVKSTFASGLNGLEGLAFDAQGNLHAAQVSSGGAGAGSVVKLTQGGVQTTFATGLTVPVGLTFDANGNLCEADHGSNSVFKLSPAGARSILAPGPSSLGLLAFEPGAVPEPSARAMRLLGAATGVGLPRQRSG